MTPELVSALGKLKCEKTRRISFCLQNRSVYRVNPLTRKKKQASVTLIELPQATPPEGRGASSRAFPSHAAKDRAAAPGAQCNSPGKERVYTPTLARRWVGRLYVLLSTQWPCRPSRLLPLLHNILTSLQQEPNSIYLAVCRKTTGALSPLAEGHDG